MLPIWEYDFDMYRELRPILPIIFYHGKQKWEVKPFEQYFGGGTLPSELLRFLPRFEYLLTDLSQYEEVEVRRMFGLLELQAGVLLMQKIFDEGLLEALGRIYAGLERWLEGEGGSFFKSSLLYLCYSKQEIGIEEIIERISKISKEGGDMAMTIAERLRTEGRTEGMEIKERKLILKMLRSGILTVSQIAELAEVSEEYVRRLQNEL